MKDLIDRQAALDKKNIVHIEMFGRDFPVVPVATLKRLPLTRTKLYRRGYQAGYAAARRELFGNSEQLDCSDCVNHGGDWDCDHVQCRKGTDTISRAAAIDVVRKAKDRSEAHRMLAQLPSAQQWIPVTPKTLPKKIGDYLVTTHSGQIARYIYMGNGSSKEYWLRCAVAWMPIPEPWKGEEHGTPRGV